MFLQKNSPINCEERFEAILAFKAVKERYYREKNYATAELKKKARQTQTYLEKETLVEVLRVVYHRLVTSKNNVQTPIRKYYLYQMIELQEKLTTWLEKCWGEDYLSYKPFLQDIFKTEHSPFLTSDPRESLLFLRKLSNKYFLFRFFEEQPTMSKKVKKQSLKTEGYIQQHLRKDIAYLINMALDDGVNLAEFKL